MLTSAAVAAKAEAAAAVPQREHTEKVKEELRGGTRAAKKMRKDDGIWWMKRITTHSGDWMVVVSALRLQLHRVGHQEAVIAQPV